MRRILCGICVLRFVFSLPGCAMLEEDPPVRMYTVSDLQSTPETTGTVCTDTPAEPVISPVTDPLLGVEITFWRWGTI